MSAVTPGLVCAHHHLYSALARGMPAPPKVADELPGDPGAGLVAPRHGARPGDDPLVGDARRPRGARERHDRDRRPPRVARTPSKGSLDVIAEACAEVGVRSCCAYGITDRHGPDGARRGLAENERFIRAGGRGLVGIHAAFTCTDESLRAAAGLAADLGVGVHVHVCEGIGDADAPRRLAGLTRDDWLLAHCVHLPTDHDLRRDDPPQPAVEPEQRGGLRQPGPVREPGGARHRRDRRQRPRGVPSGLRPAALGRRHLRRPRRPGRWLEAGWSLVPEARADEVTWSYDPMDPWHVAFTPGIMPAADRDRRRGRLRRRPADARRRRRDPCQGPGAGRPSARPPLRDSRPADSPIRDRRSCDRPDRAPPNADEEHPMSDRFHPHLDGAAHRLGLHRARAEGLAVQRAPAGLLRAPRRTTGSGAASTASSWRRRSASPPDRTPRWPRTSSPRGWSAPG